jgi:hypothetical protein
LFAAWSSETDLVVFGGMSVTNSRRRLQYSCATRVMVSVQYTNYSASNSGDVCIQHISTIRKRRKLKFLSGKRING